MENESPMSETRLWYDARDFYLGMNKTPVNQTRAIELARGCQHPDAKWLCEFHDRVEKGICEWDISHLDQTNGRDLFFLYRLGGKINESRLSAAALAGYPAAQSRYAQCLLRKDYPHNINAKQWISKAAAQNDPKGLHLHAKGLHLHARSRLQSEQATQAYELWKTAATLGYGHSQYQCAFFQLSCNDEDFWTFSINAMAKGIESRRTFNCLQTFFGELTGDVEIDSAVTSVQMKFAYHCGLQVSKLERHYPGVFESFPCQKLLDYYTRCHNGAAAAVKIWTMFAIRSHCVNHDVRKLIARLIWAHCKNWIDW